MIEQKVAETILDEPVEITVNVGEQSIKPKGFFHKLLQRIGLKPKVIPGYKRVFKIQGAKLSTMVRVSKLRLRVQQKPVPQDNSIIDYAYERVIEEARLHAEIIAAAIHNHSSEVPSDLIDFIYDNFEAQDLKDASDVVTEQLNLVDFLNTTTSIRTMNVLEMGPTK